MTALCELVDRHCRGPLTVTPVPRLALSRATTASGRADYMYHPLLCVVVRGRKQVFVGDRSFVYDPATYLVASADLPGSCRIIDAPCLSCVLTLDPAALIALLLEMPPATDAEPEPATAMAVEPLGSDLLDPLVRLVGLIDRPADVAVLAPLAEREILYRLLCSPRGPMLRQMVLPDGQASRVRSAIDVIRRRYREPLPIQELARTAGMSVTSFHRHFRAVTAMSPLRYHKQVRLLEARRLLMSRAGDAAGVGYAVGYQSPSQFSREYRRQFGIPPSRDGAAAATR